MIHRIEATPESIRQLIDGANLEFRGDGYIQVRRSGRLVSFAFTGPTRSQSGGGRGPDVIVRVANATGNVGSQTEACTLRYDIHAADGAAISTDNRLATALLPAKRRAIRGRYEAAAGGTFARAIFTTIPPATEPAWTLLEVYDEVEFAEACP